MEESDLLTNLIDKTTHLEFSDDEAPIDQIPNLTTHFPIVAKVLYDKPLNHNAIKPTLSKAWNIPPKTTINAITQNTLVFSLKTRKIAGASGDKTHGHSEVISLFQNHGTPRKPLQMLISPSIRFGRKLLDSPWSM
ncbi:UNVERIFIED_CONTAM: hypothetical protein Sradi_0149700 [Sesamum radiatum]|uniref:Uncharacterized protein n=1 Tax=Sesamum radiatum TaxID=300843 RepID=A0AAW2WKW9_SESRA